MSVTPRLRSWARIGMYRGASAAAGQAHRRGRGPLRGPRRIEDSIDRAGLQRLVGFTTVGDIDPRDLVDKAGESPRVS